jgi:hypothetical protein
MVVTLGIAEDGMKRILGLRQGATENAAVCVVLLEDLRERGLDTGRPTLFVLDGAKALHAAVTRVWGTNAVIPSTQDEEPQGPRLRECARGRRGGPWRRPIRSRVR